MQDGSPERHGSARPHDEQTFRYLLELEQRRSDRSGRSFALVLMTPETAEIRRIGPRAAAMIFSALSTCLRETDFVGWYEQGRCPAAVLTEISPTPGSEGRKAVHDKIVLLLEGVVSSVSPGFKIQLSWYPPDAMYI